MKPSLITKMTGRIVAAVDQMYLDRLQRLSMRTFVKSDLTLATSWDVKLEAQLKKILATYAPESYFVGEEGVEKKQQKNWMQSAQQQEWFWLVDPIDGTNNFINGIDYFATSIALVHQGKVVGGWVYRPSQRELSWGHHLPGQKRQVFYRVGKSALQSIGPRVQKRRRSPTFQQSLLATTHFKSCELQSSDQKQQAWLRLSRLTRSTRKMGSAALDLSYCSLGIMDGFWQLGLRPWDIAAAAFLCQGPKDLVLKNAQGKDWEVFDQSIIVGDRRWFDQFYQCILC